MSIDALLSVSQATGNSLSMTHVGRLEDSVRAGGNTYLTVTLQLVQANMALGFTDRLRQSCGLGPFSWAVRSVFYLAPPLIALAKN